MFKYVLIDIDNTLLDFNKCAEKAMTNACKACGVGFKKEMPSVFHKINDSLWQRLETGEITRDQIHEKRWNMVFSVMGITFDGRYYAVSGFITGAIGAKFPGMNHLVEGVVDTTVSAGERLAYAVFDDSMSWDEKWAYAFDPGQMVADFVTGFR